VKSEIIPIIQDQGARETSNFTETETWRRLRNSADAGVRAVEFAFIKDFREVKDYKTSPVVETISGEEFESTLRIREFFGLRFGKPKIFIFTFPEKVRRRIFLCRPKLPYFND
jgi:hypothetical protein